MAEPIRAALWQRRIRVNAGGVRAMWETVFAQSTPGVRPGEAEIARAEAELGFPLPASYLSFCRTFGAGLANGHVRIATPTADAHTDLAARAEVIAHIVGTLVGERPGHRFAVEGDDPTVVDRACFFGQTEAGAFLFWDVVPGRAEYEIWVLGADLESVRFGGADLADLLRRSQGPAVRGIFGLGAEPLPATFVGEAA